MRNGFIIASKLLGLYIIIAHVIPSLFFPLQMSDFSSRHVLGFLNSYWSVVFIALLQSVASLILVFRTEVLADAVHIHDSEVINTINMETALQTGIILIGLFILITSLPILLNQITREVIRNMINFRFHLFGFAYTLLQVIMACFMTFTSKQITHFILKNQYARHDQ